MERNGESRSGERNWIIIITIEEKGSGESRNGKKWLTGKCGDIWARGKPPVIRGKKGGSDQKHTYRAPQRCGIPPEVFTTGRKE